MKMAPLLRAFDAREEATTTLIHTGQHYDKNLSDVFFEELGIKRPEISLGIGSGSHGQQTARIIEAMEEVMQKQAESGHGFDRLVVVGDVNSTMAASLAAAKLNIPIAHVEAGLRSFDRTMPEEINRLVTDSISDMLLVSEPAGVENLKREGHSDDKIHLVGNLMIDTLLTQVERAKEQNILQELGVKPSRFGLITLHRPSNVDSPEVLADLVNVLVQTSEQLPIVFPVHPRTEARLKSFDLWKVLENAPQVFILGPLGYLDFLCLSSQAGVMVTDSGGLQEESTALGVPCLTMRSNTERPVTVTDGTSTLIGNDAEKLQQYLQQVLDGTYKQGKCPALWDGEAAPRIADILISGHLAPC